MGDTTVGQGIVNDHRYMARHLSEKLDVVFTEAALIKSAHDEEAQFRTPAEQRNRVLALHLLARRKQAIAFRNADDLGGLPAVSTLRSSATLALRQRLLCAIGSMTEFVPSLRVENDVEEIEIDHRAQFGCDAGHQVFWSRRRQTPREAQ